MDVTSPPRLCPSAGQLAASVSAARTAVLAEAATKLGITVDQLRAELDAGQPLAHIAEVAGVSLSGPAQDGPSVVVQDAPRGAQLDLLL